jgi:hypothetical protein
MDFSNILFRCSASGHLMTDPQSKEAKARGDISEGCKTHLIDVYVANKYGRHTDISNKYTEKGLKVEEDSITLYSRVKKTFFRKNDLRLSNDFIKGTPDLFTGIEISSADTIIDIKSSWDIYTFFRVHTQPMNKLYYWQLQSYMALTGARSAKLVYCLVNTPDTFLLDEKRKLFYRMNAGTEENKEYQEACEKLEASMYFDDIPMHERVIEFEVERNDEDIERMYRKIEKCRTYLNALEKQLNPPVAIAEHDHEVNATIVQ